MGDVAPDGTVGSFTELAGLFVALYVQDGTLQLRMGEEIYPLDDEAVVAVEGELSSRELTVSRHGKEVAKHQYAVDESQIIEGDETAFVDEEDYDFGMWLANVSKNPERKQVLLDPKGDV
jgi:hypothetical protein